MTSMDELRPVDEIDKADVLQHIDDYLKICGYADKKIFPDDDTGEMLTLTQIRDEIAKGTQLGLEQLQVWDLMMRG